MDSGLSGALAAQAEEQELVTIKAEALGREFREVAAAAVELVDLSAAPAVEVVVVGLGEFITRRFAGDLDGRDFARFDQQFERAVDGGETQGIKVLGREVEDLLWRDRGTGLGDGIADRGPLAGLAFGGGGA